jgi:hypothetical protein
MSWIIRSNLIEGRQVVVKRECPIWVKLRRTQYEQMSSGLPLKADIAQCSRHVSKVPEAD